jgi:hypothetical protein
MLFHPSAVAKAHGSQLLTEWAFCTFPRESVSIPMMFLIHIYISYLMNSDGHGDGIAAVAFQRLFFIQTPLQKQKITENRKHTHPVFPSRESSGVCPKAILQLGRLQLSGQETFVLGCP